MTTLAIVLCSLSAGFIFGHWLGSRMWKKVADEWKKSSFEWRSLAIAWELAAARLKFGVEAKELIDSMNKAQSFTHRN